MKAIFLSLLSFSALALDPPPGMKLSCEIGRVPNCVGGVSYHCGVPGYEVTCHGSIRARSGEHARSIIEKLEQEEIAVP